VLPPLVAFADWATLAATRATARDHAAEGLMLKRADSPYHVGRKRGDWWKWKLDPLVIDAVMIYAQAGHGRRANLFTDFTFAVWDGGALVPFTKAYSGLTDAEFRRITAWVRRNTQQRFGPVRQVTPHQVFEIAFEGLHESPRHKSGVALRFPRMSRWREDKPPEEAGTLDELKAMLAAYG
jgi:DNA ligase-1